MNNRQYASVVFGVATTIMLFVFFGFGWQSWTLFGLLAAERLLRPNRTA